LSRVAVQEWASWQLALRSLTAHEPEYATSIKQFVFVSDYSGSGSYTGRFAAGKPHRVSPRRDLHGHAKRSRDKLLYLQSENRRRTFTFTSIRQRDVAATLAIYDTMQC